MDTTERIQRLREVFTSLGGESTFTEHQEASRGDVPDDAEVDARLERLVRELREESGFRTRLDDAALVAIVRGYYDGEADAEMADRLGVSTEQVARARVNLRLFRPADRAGPFDGAALRELLDDGATAAEAAAALDVSESAVRRYAHVLRVQRDARRSGYRYAEEFEEHLGIADDARIAHTHLVDRRTMDEVVD
jgi:DNA-directed RNA polymerase specialized sigma24 family protein